VPASILADFEEGETLTMAPDPLLQFVANHPRLLVLTGAGCSLASGIPTYRDAAGEWRRNAPIQHRDFVTRPDCRRRYWARSFAGWPAVASARPNAAHRALAALEQAGHVQLLVTQNVDRLHQRAGQQRIIDLHGALAEVLCLQCGDISSRESLQGRLAQLNPHLQEEGHLAPDGDADVSDVLVEQVVVPDCEHCGGILKPHVVFFGDGVPRQRVEAIVDELEGCDGLLVVGSSLMVFSGYRFVRHAHRLGIPVACINPGLTRADEMFTLKVAEDCGMVLQQLLAKLRVPDRIPAPA
jgi:NAD-dependent SIR2 family protein deacetylase